MEDKVISTRGLKPDAKVFCEFVFDVNTVFFEERGGYEFARDFFHGSIQNGDKGGGRRAIYPLCCHAR